MGSDPGDHVVKQFRSKTSTSIYLAELFLLQVQSLSHPVAHVTWLLLASPV